MIVPVSYAEWVKCFEALIEGNKDEEVMEAMERGTLSWSSGVAERFSIKLFEVINQRLQKSSRIFQRNLDNARGNETAIVNALLGIRRELVFLKRLTMLPAIPPDKQGYFSQQILAYAQNTQQSLENSAKADRTGRLSSLIKNNRINNI